MPDNRIFYFWFDCETTGLEIQHDAVLEVAWTVTDDEFRMITPLRQRFTNLGLRAATGAQFDGEWHELNDVVSAMHDTSGLATAWDGAHPLSKITNSKELERLFVDDLVAAGFYPYNTEERAHDRLVLAGAGVSHFDNRVLYEHMPFFYPRETGFDGYWAYWRTFDTSTLWRGLGEKTARRIRDKAIGDDAPYSILACENPGDKADPALRHLTWLDSNNEFRFDPAAIVKHRAADDVVESLITARAVRALSHLGLA